MELITAGMRKSIKIMSVVSQTANYISLMPKPKEFIMKVINDVVYISGQVKKLTDNLNKMLDEYADMPGEYLMTGFNEISDALTGSINILSDYSKTIVDNTVGLAENTMQNITEMTGTIIDSTGALTSSVIGLASSVAHSSAAILGNPDTADDIQNASSVILEWNNNGFTTASNTSKGAIDKVTQKITNKLDGTYDEDGNLVEKGVYEEIDDVTKKINDKLNLQQKQEWVQEKIKKLRDDMRKFEQYIDKKFHDSTGMISVNTQSQQFLDALGNMEVDESDPNNTTAQKAIRDVTQNLMDAINNFSIGKVITAMTGVTLQVTLLSIGIEELPHIDVEGMLNKLRDKAEGGLDSIIDKIDEKIISNHDNKVKDYTKFKETDDYKSYINSDEYKKYENSNGEIPEPTKNFPKEAYRKFCKEREEDRKKEREELRKKLRDNKKDSRKEEREQRKKQRNNPEYKTSIKEARKQRRMARNSKIANTLKDNLLKSFKVLGDEVTKRYHRIETDWNNMMNQYRTCIADMTAFLQGGGPGSRRIDKCCNDINTDCNNIVDLCKGIGDQLMHTVIKAGNPPAIGPAVAPNPVYTFSMFKTDIKTIFKFIKDLIGYIINILGNVKILAEFLLNGLKNLDDIFKELMELLGLQWLIDMIQGIIDMFSEKLTDAKDILENTVSPVHFNETDTYDNAMSVFESISDGLDMSSEEKSYLSAAENTLRNFGKDGKSLANDVKNVRLGRVNKEDDLGKISDKLDEMGEWVVAYKSPIVDRTGSEKNTEELMNGDEFTEDIKFSGWIYYHPNLDHTGKTYYNTDIMKKIKGRLIKRVSKTGGKKNGGVNKLKKAKVGRLKRRVSAYDAFFWYTVKTNDITEDTYYENAPIDTQTVYISSSLQTENGSIVELNDGRKVFVASDRIRSGDYVTVDGVKYRVK